MQAAARQGGGRCVLVGCQGCLWMPVVPASARTSCWPGACFGTPCVQCLPALLQVCNVRYPVQILSAPRAIIGDMDPVVGCAPLVGYFGPRVWCLFLAFSPSTPLDVIIVLQECPQRGRELTPSTHRHLLVSHSTSHQRTPFACSKKGGCKSKYRGENTRKQSPFMLYGATTHGRPAGADPP